jgi:hypothetical protein
MESIVYPEAFYVLSRTIYLYIDIVQRNCSAHDRAYLSLLRKAGWDTGTGTVAGASSQIAPLAMYRYCLGTTRRQSWFIETFRTGNVNSRSNGVTKHHHLEYNNEIAQKKNKGLASLWLELVLLYHDQLIRFHNSL